MEESVSPVEIKQIKEYVKQLGETLKNYQKIYEEIVCTLEQKAQRSLAEKDAQKDKEEDEEKFEEINRKKSPFRGDEEPWPTKKKKKINESLRSREEPMQVVVKTTRAPPPTMLSLPAVRACKVGMHGRSKGKEQEDGFESADGWSAEKHYPKAAEWFSTTTQTTKKRALSRVGMALASQLKISQGTPW